MIELNVGDVVAGRLEVAAILGENELGKQYKMSDKETHEDFFVYQLSFECPEERVLEIQADIATIRSIFHKSIACVKGLETDGDTGYLLLDFIDGDTLEDHLKQRRERGQILGLKTAYSFLSHICLGLDMLHQRGCFYGCLSPKMIYVTREGRIRVVNYICSALARRYLPDEAKKAFFGSKFTAPEVRESLDLSKPTVDVYSLSLLFTELLSEKSLSDFDGSPEAFIAMLPGVSTTIKESLFQAAKPEIEDRFPNIQMFKDTLKNAVDAPADNEISSIVIGVNDLRSINSSTESPAVTPAPSASTSSTSSPVQKKVDLFDSAPHKSSNRIVHKDVWIYQKDGMDFGPFDHDGLIQKFYEDVIDESTSIYNTSTKKRANLFTIKEFEKEVQEYLPIRNHNRAEKAKAEKRKQRAQKMAGGGSILVVLGVLAAILITPIIILSRLPDPVPIDLDEAIPTFAKEFKLPKMESVSLNVDDSRSRALFDPEATEAEREAALKAWEEEHRKRYAGHKRPAAAKTGDGGEEIETLVFGTDDDGHELEPLQDWEIEEVCMSPRMLRKVQDCYANHAGGRRPKITVNFTIQQSGAVRNLNTTADGELNKCIVSAFSSMSYRKFGGTVKKVSIPIG